jgi:hypothetical protein
MPDCRGEYVQHLIQIAAGLEKYSARTAGAPRRRACSAWASLLSDSELGCSSDDGAAARGARARRRHSADVVLTNALFSRRSRLAACSSADDGLGD